MPFELLVPKKCVVMFEQWGIYASTHSSTVLREYFLVLKCTVFSTNSIKHAMQFIFCNIPDNRVIDPKVIVYQAVPHS